MAAWPPCEGGGEEGGVKHEEQHQEADRETRGHGLAFWPSRAGTDGADQKRSR